jgi:Flp pilus assembly protein TadG
MTNRFFAKLRNCMLRGSWRRFGAATEGNTVVTFALAFIPIVGLVGAAVDYSRASALQTAMQAAADSTALMVAQSAASQSASAVQTSANNFYQALFTRSDASNLQVTGTYSNTNGSTVVIKATATYKTSFMGIMGFSQIPLAATSTTSFGNSRLRVALVLDNTGSMSQSGKITALKTATNNLLTQLKNAVTTNGDVYVSIIPFVKDVNVDPVNYNATWIDWTDWNANHGTCSSGGGGGRSGGGGTQSSCSGTWTPANHNTWNGCVTDRGDPSNPDPANYDTNVVAPNTSITATLWPAEQYSPCPQAAMGLSYNWTSMTTLVNNMSPGGNTNQAIGLALGWMSLVGGGPFTAPAMDPNYTYQQVIILLTDGLNNTDRWYTTQSQVDARQTLTCNNIKAAGITLYTIQVNTDGSPTSSLLQQCATDSSKFFLLTSSSEIVTTFNAIGTNLSKLRIAK